MTGSGTRTDVPTDVPSGDASDRCPYCGRPLRSEHLLALHVGEAHPGHTDREAAAYAEAREAEDEELFVYHMKVIGAIVLLFFAVSYTYVFVLV
ncbi:hypothetical protein BRC94_09875 [Halobacteriales archaeon QS_5_70_17]|nr:MAG: hypothetical protein BRC94_09875 [Halobacteriales archaeon QS_5_70_17]